MKKIIFILLLLMPTILLADELRIPFSCYPKKVQECFKDKGYKLDLSGNERDESSWGFLENNGSNFKIFTYYSLTKEELNTITSIIWESENANASPNANK